MAPSQHDWKIVDWDVKPQHKQTKQTKWHVGPAKTDQPGYRPSLRCSHEETLGPLSYSMSTQWRLIRLGWSESSLGAQLFCWFCHEVAHMFYLLFLTETFWTLNRCCILQRSIWAFTYEPQHDKTNKMSVRPAKTQISLGICPVWSVSSLCTQWVAKDQSFLHVDSEDPDQTGQMPRLIWVFTGGTVTLLVSSWGGLFAIVTFRNIRHHWWRLGHSHFVGFVMRGLICHCHF